METFIYVLIVFTLAIVLLEQYSTIKILKAEKRRNQETVRNAEQQIHYLNNLQNNYDALLIYNRTIESKYVHALEQPNNFTNNELRFLISSCHPDRHGGKPMSIQVTQKLLAMRA